MSSKFNIELAQGTITVEGDQDFIMSVYQALQSTLLSGNAHSAAPAPTETVPQEAAQDEEASTGTPEPELAAVEATPDESEAGHDEKITSINVAEAEPQTLDEAIEQAAPMYEPIPSVLDPDRAEREKAEAEERATKEAEDVSVSPEQSSVLEQIKDSLGEDEEPGNQTSILQRIRDSLSEDAGEKAEDAPRAADAG